MEMRTLLVVFGRLLVGLGVIRESELHALLSPQADFRLGRLLVDCGALDPRAVERALEHSRKTGRRLGETLVESGLVPADVVQAVLARQRRLTRLACLIAFLSTFSAAPAVAGDLARVQVVATVLPRASVEAQRLPQEITVSADDVARGYVELQAPVEIGVRTNYPNGVIVRFTGNGAEVAGVEVDGGGPLVPVAHVGRGMQRLEVRVRLRLRLAPRTVPGRIAFPVKVSLAT